MNREQREINRERFSRCENHKYKKHTNGRYYCIHCEKAAGHFDSKPPSDKTLADGRDEIENMARFLRPTLEKCLHDFPKSDKDIKQPICTICGKPKECSHIFRRFPNNKSILGKLVCVSCEKEQDPKTMEDLEYGIGTPEKAPETKPVCLHAFGMVDRSTNGENVCMKCTKCGWVVYVAIPPEWIEALDKKDAYEETLTLEALEERIDAIESLLTI